MTDKPQKVLVLAPSPESKGGISSVIAVYRDYGLFACDDVILIATYVDGSKLLKAGVAVKALWTVATHLLARRVGCLHAHVAIDASFWRKALFMALSGAFGCPFIFHLHAGRFPHFYATTLGNFGRCLARWLFRRAGRVAVLSPEWARWVQSVEPSARTIVIPNPALTQARDQNRTDEGMILFLGRLAATKGTIDLLEAFRTVLRAHPAASLWLAGDGDIDEIAARARALNIEQNTRMLGWVRGDQKTQLMSRASVFVLPSYFEGLPMSILEAMAWGIPVVATTVGGIPFAITDGVEGFLIQPGDKAGLADAMRRLLENPGLRTEMGRAGRQRVESRFSAGTIIPEIRRMYLEMTTSVRQDLPRCP